MALTLPRNKDTRNVVKAVFNAHAQFACKSARTLGCNAPRASAADAAGGPYRATKCERHPLEPAAENHNMSAPSSSWGNR